MLKFESLSDVRDYVKAFKKSPRKYYPRVFRTALIEYALATNISIKRIAKIIEVGEASVYSWRSNYITTLTPDETTPVSTPLKETSLVIAELNTQIKALQNQIELIKRLEALGYTITQGNK